MLFLGTHKFPDQNEYSNFLSKNSGANNASTRERETNFYFSCSNNALYGALDRFAHFFIDPLFNESCTDRELHAVE